ncbi:MAG: YceK/YidQ family lipoprotein [Thiohalomonadales bacterium]
MQTHTDDSITPLPYSGTRRATDKTLRSLIKYDYYGEFFIRAMDIPLSFISDTVILPYDLYQQTNK